ncbi:DNA modification methylase [Candidatus Nomurabacteria bacterium]|nr:DNA modification methylase [Candidatus Nomurabacteria bacterium]
MGRIKIKHVDIKKIKPATYNPRTHDAEMLLQLEKSIKEFGLLDPVIVNSNPDRKGVLIGGHARYKVARKLGYKTIPVVYTNLNLEQEKILNVKLNKISGDWDFSKLNELFNEDFLIDLGFDEPELQSVWDETLESDNDDFEIDEELKKIKRPRTKKGDLIILGKHRLLCADSTDPNAVKALFGDEKVSVIYSDPPFNINLDYNKGVGNKNNYGGDVDDNKSPEEYKEFIRKTIVNALSVSKDDVHCFQWADEAWIWVFQTLYNELGVKNRRLNIWLKNNSSPTPSVPFNKAIECCVYGTRGKPFISDSLKNLNEVMNKELTNGNELYEEVTNVWAVKRLASNKYEHPTSKPPSLHEKAIKKCSKVGDIIFDSFSGSASTMICAEQLKRRVYSLEISEVFCDLAIRRWEKMTGRKVKVIKKYYEKR